MKEKFYWLDALRFIAAFVVVINHTSMEFITNYAGLDSCYHSIFYAVLYLMLHSGGEAVLVFFVLSGFLVGGRSIEKLRLGIFDPRQYFIDRFVRIMLPLLPALILSFIVNQLVGEHFFWYEYLGNLLSLQNFCVRPVNGVLWSLSNEVWFYIFMFGIALFVMDNKKLLPSSSKKNISVNGDLVGGVILVISSFMFFSFGFSGLVIWFIGAFAYCMRNYIVKKKRTLLVFLLLFVAEFYYKQTWWKGGLLIPSIPTPSRDFVLLVYAILIGYVLCWFIKHVPHRTSLIKVNEIGERLAKFSYTLYLCHYPILLLIKKYVYFDVSNRMDVLSIGIIIVVAIVATILCYPLYMLSEKHTYEVKAYFTSKIKNYE